MAADQHPLERAIAAQEALRGAVPDDVVDAAVAALRQQLAQLDAASPRRRQVTVLFADVSGFTAMSEQMDPELLSRRMNEIWARLDAVVGAHGGHVDKHIGDAMMALWGAEGTREDDPESAVRAGLTLQAELAAMTSDTGLQVAMRVGISTGPVHLGAVGTSTESTAMGDTVNVASRLEHLAPVNGVLISHETYRSVRGVFDVQPLGEVDVRGRTESVGIYLVERAKQRVFRIPTRGVEGVETKTIGRDAELRTLRDSFTQVVDCGGARLALVVAEAGTGKSRLLYEFLNWVELERSNAFLFTGRALANRQTVGLGLFRDVVATRFEIGDGDPPAEVLRKLEEGLTGHLSTDEADIVGHWLGFDVSSSEAVQRLLGSQFAATARAHLTSYFAALAATDTLILALEDLHWADDESLDLLVDLLRQLRDGHFLVVGLTRPTLFERHADYPGEAVSATRLDLAALTDSDCRLLAREVLQRATEVPDALVELIASRADGNPFYVEELIKMLIDDDVIDIDEEVWHVDLSRLDPGAVPTSLTGVLQARLDSLSLAERKTLQCGAVMGRVFWEAAVAALARETYHVGVSLDVARRRELVFRRQQTSFRDTDEYMFKHALLCDVIYETVLLGERPLLHAVAAAWLESAAGDRVAEYREMIAGHLRAAGQFARAAEHLWRAGEAMLATGVPAAAARSLSTAVELWDEAGVAPPVVALLPLAEALALVGDTAAAEVALGRARPRAVTAAERADVANFASWVAALEGQPDRERVLLAEALPLAEEAGGPCLIRTLIGLVWSESNSGELSAAEEHAARALTLAEELDDLTEMCRALGASALVVAEQGDLEASQRCVERQLAVAVVAGNLDAQARALDNLGVVIHLRGDAEGDDDLYREAIRNYRRGIEIHDRLGERQMSLMMTLNMAQAHVRLGLDDAARLLISDVAAAAIDLRSELVQCLCLVGEADRLISRGQVAVGLAYLGLHLRQRSAGSIDQHEADRVLARASLSRDVIEAGMAAGADLDLETVVRLLAGGGESRR